MPDSLLILELQEKGAHVIVQDVIKTREKVAPILGRISAFFTEYTNHDISHSDQVLMNLNWIIPKKVMSKFNIIEIQILLLACYLHDVGMVIDEKEASEITRSWDYILYKKQALIRDNNIRDDKEILRDYVRLIHHRRSEKYIVENYRQLGIEDYNIARAVGILARGHREEDLHDPEKFDNRYYIVSGKDPACLPFLAGCLRLADEVDITRTRTPELLLKLVNPNNPISKDEWEKHKSTLAIGTDQNKIKIQAVCNNPIIHKSILLTARKIDDTLDMVRKTISNLPQDLKDKYFIEIDGVAQPKIEEIGYLYRNFKFDFDTSAVSKMLMGEKLYHSKYDACRELLQNSIDTCRLKSRLKADWKPSIRIGLSKDKKTLWVEDNGMGMNEFIIENYLLKIGRTYYKSVDFSFQYPDLKINPISEFGIGILSCFMISENFVIETLMEGAEARRLEISDIGEDVVVRPCTRHDPGTKVELCLKSIISKELSDAKLVEIVKHYIRHVEIPVNVVSSDGGETQILDAGYDFKIAEVMKPFKITKKTDYQTIETYFEPANSNGIKGNIGTILKKTPEGYLVPVYWAWRDFKPAFGNFDINISQKGIYVSEDISRRTWYRQGWFGELNIEISGELELRLSRDSFILSKTENILDIVIQRAISKLIKEIFLKWKKLDRNTTAKLTHEFIEGYFSSSKYYSNSFSMISDVRQTINNSFVFRIVSGNSISFSNLRDLVKRIESFTLLPLGLDAKEVDILEEAQVIRQELNSNNLLLAGSQVSPPGAFEFLVEFLCNNYYWNIATSNSTRRSYYQFKINKKPISQEVFNFLTYGMILADFENEKQLIGTYIGLQRFINKDHRFVRKLISLSGRLKSKEVELVNAFFYEVDDCLNEMMGKVTDASFSELINKQRIILEMLEQGDYVSKSEKEELLVNQKELPKWKYAGNLRKA